ncbi:unnamed protein product [Prorocentrum cordatum]|uniref:BHLH domain-containing protein n=1 Tax=Prorocentrum cordatum TaxID=2364126 RepID=A0ABN9WNH7_9DINO|nr:unnamed protein product [Polarella glacialis]
MDPEPLRRRARRPNRTAAQRRAQYARAQGRVAQHLLKAFDEIVGNPGQQLTFLGKALREALAGGPDAGPDDAVASAEPEDVPPHGEGGDDERDAPPPQPGNAEARGDGGSHKGVALALTHPPLATAAAAGAAAAAAFATTGTQEGETSIVEMVHALRAEIAAATGQAGAPTASAVHAVERDDTEREEKAVAAHEVLRGVQGGHFGTARGGGGRGADTGSAASATATSPAPGAAAARRPLPGISPPTDEQCEQQ